MRNVAFDVAAKYAVGARTSVGLNADGIVVAVEQLGTRALMQRLGRIDVGAIAFGPPTRYSEDGIHPSIAISGPDVVEVHQTRDTTTNLVYHLGTIRNDALDLGKPTPYDTGSDPAVAINSAGVVVGLQNGPTEDSATSTALFVRVGQTRRLSTGALVLDHWGPADKKMLVGRAVNGAVALNNQGLVVVAFRKPGQFLTIIAGQVVGFDIVWGPQFNYGNGTLPTLALTDDNIVVEAHLEQQSDRTTFLTFSNVGPLDPATKSVNFPADRGNILAPVKAFERSSNKITTLNANTNNVSVAANRALAVETFSDANNDVGYSASLIIDRANWMGDNLPAWGQKVLGELSIPGSHDAATYKITRCTTFGRPCAAMTQDDSFLEQLRSGVRYFDVRPAIFENELYTGHFGDIGSAAALGLTAAAGAPAGAFGALIGVIVSAAGGGVDRIQGCLGPPLAEVLADVAQFMRSGAREVVILKFSHYLDLDSDSDKQNGVSEFDEAQTTRLVSAVVAALGEYLYTAPLPNPRIDDPRKGRLASTPLSTLLGSRGIVLPVFDRTGAVFNPQPGTYSYLDFLPLPPVVIRGPEPDPSREAEERAPFQQANLLVYDKFANTSSLQQMSDDQLAKLRTVSNHGGDLFLFSWTLTLSDPASLTCSDTTGTRSLATTADNALAAAVTAEYARGGITQSTLPNILFVDRASDFATDVSVWLDQRMALGDTLVGARRDYLGPGDSLVSANGIYRLTYRPNGDLVLSGPGRAGSVSKTAGQPAWRCIMQEDGNFVIYSSPYVPVFASDTDGHPGSRFVLSNDGKFGIFDGAGTRLNTPKLQGT